MYKKKISINKIILLSRNSKKKIKTRMEFFNLILIVLIEIIILIELILNKCQLLFIIIV